MLFALTVIVSELMAGMLWDMAEIRTFRLAGSNPALAAISRSAVNEIALADPIWRVRPGHCVLCARGDERRPGRPRGDGLAPGEPIHRIRHGRCHPQSAA